MCTRCILWYRPFTYFQVDRLNSLLLSEKARYEQLSEEATANRNETALMKTRHDERLHILTTELDMFKKNTQQVHIVCGSNIVDTCVCHLEGVAHFSSHPLHVHLYT